MVKNEVINQLTSLNGIDTKLAELLVQTGKIVEFPKGKIIMRQREPVDAVYFQLNGKSMIYNLTHHGKRKILFLCGKGTLLNENINKVEIMKCNMCVHRTEDGTAKPMCVEKCPMGAITVEEVER